MRKIKFRGKRKGKAEWVFGDLLTGLEGDCYIIITHEEGVTKYEVNPDSVGQFTGLKDINGREIYEGDLLNIWCGGNLQANPYVVNDMCELYFESERDDSYYRITKMEIIGNITDNPELLKGGE